MLNQLVGASAVITARQFNPSVMSQLWLVRQGLIAEDQMLPNFVFTDLFVQVRTEKFALLVVPEQFQFFPQVEKSEEQELIQQKVGRIVRNLPHTPFKAVGLNFTWHVTPQSEEVAMPQLSRRLFFQNKNPLYEFFNEENAMFGAYLSKDFRECRLKLDIKPQLSIETPVQILQLAFNFHVDLRQNEELVTQIETILSRWNDASTEAERIVQALRGVSE